MIRDNIYFVIIREMNQSIHIAIYPSITTKKIVFRLGIYHHFLYLTNTKSCRLQMTENSSLYKFYYATVYGAETVII